jgi:hypothetical protein
MVDCFPLPKGRAIWKARAIWTKRRNFAAGATWDAAVIDGFTVVDVKCWHYQESNPN